MCLKGAVGRVVVASLCVLPLASARMRLTSHTHTINPRRWGCFFRLIFNSMLHPWLRGQPFPIDLPNANPTHCLFAGRGVVAPRLFISLYSFM